MRQKQPSETDEQRKEREAAERDNVRSIQENLVQRTGIFRRMAAPTVSLTNGTRRRRMSLFNG